MYVAISILGVVFIILFGVFSTLVATDEIEKDP